MNKKIISLFFIPIGILLISTSASAHVSVSPKEVGVGKSQNFSVSVPVEKDIPTTELRLLIPEGIESVRPNVKSGWVIEMKKENNSSNAKVTEILWKNGNIPAELKDEFIFSAKTSTKPETIQWKAYQTYQDGTVVSWDQDPKNVEHTKEDSNTGPYSETKVVDDLSNNNSTNEESKTNILTYTALALGLIGITLGIINLVTSKKETAS